MREPRSLVERSLLVGMRGSQERESWVWSVVFFRFVENLRNNSSGMRGISMVKFNLRADEDLETSWVAKHFEAE